MLNRILFVLQLGWRSVASRWVQTVATLLVIGLALALFIAVAVLNVGVREGLTEASDPFGTLVIGPKGDAQQLVLSTILLNGNPLGTIDEAIYKELLDDPRAALVIPLAMADNIGNARIIGTTVDFFTLQPSLNSVSPFQLAEGRLFEVEEHHANFSEAQEETNYEEARVFEAVLGATAAEQLGLTIGDQFVSSHGTGAVLNADVHKEPFEVIGVLQQTNTAFDGAVFTTLNAVWDSHRDEFEAAFASKLDNTAGAGDLTAILVKPVGFGEANGIWQSFYNRNDAQAAFPGQELGRLLNTFDQLEDILSNVGYLAALMAGITIFLTIYSATKAREQLIAVMRGVGAGRGAIVGMVLIEALIIAVLGALLARLLGYGAATVLASRFSAQNMIPIPVRYLFELEPFLWGVPIVLALVAGLIPALMAFRINVVEKLFGQ